MSTSVERPQPAAEEPQIPAGATAPIEHEQVIESGDARRARLSTGALVVVIGLLLLGLGIGAHGSAKFAFSNAFDAVQFQPLSVPGKPTVLTCAVLCLLAGAGYLSGKLHRRLPWVAGAVAGLAAVIWGAGVAFHLLQWKMGDSQTSLLFPAWPEALGVEQSKALAPGGFSGWEARLGSSGMLSPGLEVGPASHRRRWVRVRAAPGQGGSADFGC